MLDVQEGSQPQEEDLDPSLPVTAVTVRDKTRIAQFQGVLLAEATSRREGSPRWTSLALYVAVPTQRGRPYIYVVTRCGGSRVVHSSECRFARSRNLPTGAALPADVLTDLAAALARSRFTPLGPIDRARRSDMLTEDPSPDHARSFNCVLDFGSPESMNTSTLRFERPLEGFAIFDFADAAVESFYKLDTTNGQRELPWLARKLLDKAVIHDKALARAYTAVKST